MHVRNVRADGEMDGHGDLMLVGSYEDAGIRVFDFDDPAIKELPGGFTVADADAMRKFGEFVDVLAGFGGHAELAFAEARIDVFGGVAGEGDFEIVDERRAVHGDSETKPRFIRSIRTGPRPTFDDVAADAPEDGFALFARAVNGAEKMAKILGGEKVGK